MSRNFIGTSSQYLEYSNAVASAAPLTIVAWIYGSTVSGSSGTLSIAGIYKSTSTVINGFQLALNNNTVRAQTGDGASSNFATTTATVLANTWTHTAAVFASATSRAVYLNGTNKQTNSTSRVPSALNVTDVGRVNGTAPTAYFTGLIAEVAYWNVALTDAEILQLSQGISALAVRAQNLLAYYPLDGAGQSTAYNAVPWNRQYDLTVNGPTPESNSPVLPTPTRHRRKLFISPGTASFLYSADGQVILSGTAQLNYTYAGSGSLFLAGSVNYSENLSYAGSGELFLNGSFNSVLGASQFAYNAFGELFLGFGSSNSVALAYNATGAFKLGGNYYGLIGQVASGSMFLTGSANYSENLSYRYVGTGSLFLAGSFIYSGPKLIIDGEFVIEDLGYEFVVA